MIATCVLVLATLAFLEAFDRSSTPRQRRTRITQMTVAEHTASAWHGLVLLTCLHQRDHRRSRHGDSP